MGFGFCFLMIPRHVKIVFAAPMCFRICVVFRNLRFFECSFQAAGNRRKAAFVVGDGYGEEKKEGGGGAEAEWQHFHFRFLPLK